MDSLNTDFLIFKKWQLSTNDHNTSGNASPNKQDENTLQKVGSVDFIAECAIEGAQNKTNNVATNVVAKSSSENVTTLDENMDLADIVTASKKRAALNRDEKYRYYKNHFNPGEKDQLYQKNITMEGEEFNLNFKYKWLTYHPWHVYSKELSGGLCKICVLFDKPTTNRGIFAKNVF